MNIFALWSESSEFPLFLIGNSLQYTSTLDDKHVYGMNYAYEPSFYYHFKKTLLNFPILEIKGKIKNLW